MGADAGAVYIAPVCLASRHVDRPMHTLVDLSLTELYRWAGDSC